MKRTTKEMVQIECLLTNNSEFHLLTKEDPDKKQRYVNAKLMGEHGNVNVRVNVSSHVNLTDEAD